ncbi:MAG: radical SAM protein, partial [Planctomycetota bacterium]
PVSSRTTRSSSLSRRGSPAEKTGRGWLRLMYAYPTTFTDPVIDAFAELAARGILLPYIDIPLQHASDNMLTAMRRNVTARTQRELIDKLRERIPGMAVRTTFISGFPGETDADHEQLLEFIEHCAFEAVGVFTYSTEPGTPAGTMADDPALAVPHEVALERKHELMALQQALAFEQNEYLAEQFDPECPLESGLRFDVLIDEPMGEDETGAHLARGRTYFQAPQIDPVTYVRSRERRTPGELVRCVLTEADGYDLIAVPVDDLGVRVSLPLA